MPETVTVNAPAMPQNPVDPNVKVPANVSRMAALAESYYKQATEPPKKEDLPQPQQPAHTHAQPVAQPGLPETTSPPTQPEQTPNYEHMYNSMKGRFQQQQTINNQLAAEVQQQQAFVENLKQRLNALENPPAPKQVMTPEERAAYTEYYGEQFFQAVDKRVQELVGDKVEKIDELERRNQHLEQQLQRTSNRTLHQIVVAQVPNYRELNNDPGFLQWLSLRDIYSGQSRNTLLQSAFRRGDAPALIAFYKGYLAETGQLRPQLESAPPAPQQAPVQLEALVAPGAPRPAIERPDLAPQKRHYSRREIAAYYDQKRRGYWAGKDAEWNALEHDFTAAAREGRITN